MRVFSGVRDVWTDVFCMGAIIYFFSEFSIILRSRTASSGLDMDGVVACAGVESVAVRNEGPSSSDSWAAAKLSASFCTAGPVIPKSGNAFQYDAWVILRKMHSGLSTIGAKTKMEAVDRVLRFSRRLDILFRKVRVVWVLGWFLWYSALSDISSLESFRLRCCRAFCRSGNQWNTMGFVEKRGAYVAKTKNGWPGFSTSLVQCPATVTAYFRIPSTDAAMCKYMVDYCKVLIIPMTL